MPHDGLQHDKTSGTPIADLYRQHGVAMLKDRATFVDGGNSVEAGIADLARCLGPRLIALMKRHGCVVVGTNVKDAVMAANYLQVNARMQMQALQLGTPDYLTPLEVEKCQARLQSPLGMDRAGEYWCLRAGDAVGSPAE